MYNLLKPFFLFSVVCNKIEAQNTQIPVTQCKAGWQNWGGKCFYMSTGTKNWWDAKQDCIRRGGRLFEPRGKEINELVYSHVPGPSKCYWVGISDIDNEGKYVYASDNQPLAYTNFRPGYPLSNSSKNCFLYACDRSHPFKFWDYGCEVSIRYVCEDMEGNSECGVPDSILVENSFKVTDVEMCKGICNSIQACKFYTWSKQSLACGIRTIQSGGLLEFPNLETGSPYIEGTIQDKIFVGKVDKRSSAKACQLFCQEDPLCKSWTWFTLSHSLPNTCSLHYGETQTQQRLPSPSHLVSGPRCCDEEC